MLDTRMLDLNTTPPSVLLNPPRILAEKRKSTGQTDLGGSFYALAKPQSFVYGLTVLKSTTFT